MNHAPLTILTAVLFLGLSTPSAPAEGAGIEWDTLNEEILKLLGTGKYDRGVIVAKHALSVAESNVGPNHPAVAATLNNLALLYKGQSKYAVAELLFKRSLAIYEKDLGARKVARMVPVWRRLCSTLLSYTRCKASTHLRRRSLSVPWQFGRKPVARIISMWSRA